MPHRLDDRELGGEHMSRKQLLLRLDLAIGHAAKVPLALAASGRSPAAAGRLDERPLEAVALNLLDAVVEHGRGERDALAAGRGQHFPVRHDFGLQERRLIQQVVAVAVVARDLDGHDVLARREFPAQVPLVDPVVPVRAARRAVAEELAVDTGPVEGRGGHPQHGLLLGRRGDDRAEADQQIHLRLAARRPNRLGGPEHGGFVSRYGRDETECQANSEPVRGAVRHIATPSTSVGVRRTEFNFRGR